LNAAHRRAATQQRLADLARRQAEADQELADALAHLDATLAHNAAVRANPNHTQRLAAQRAAVHQRIAAELEVVPYEVERSSGDENLSKATVVTDLLVDADRSIPVPAEIVDRDYRSELEAGEVTFRR
jgi:uncharacterized membrane protein YgaE (UPF0421/DUF939 family)